MIAWNSFAFAMTVCGSAGWVIWIAVELEGSGWKHLNLDPELDVIGRAATTLSHLGPIGAIAGLIGMTTRGWRIGMLAFLLGCADATWLYWIVYR